MGKVQKYQSSVEKRRVAPTRLIFYRGNYFDFFFSWSVVYGLFFFKDGVSEGQFSQVLEEGKVYFHRSDLTDGWLMDFFFPKRTAQHQEYVFPLSEYREN